MENSQHGLSIVYTTVGSAEDAAQLAETLLRERLCACVKVSGPMTSYYTWEDKRADGVEHACLIKVPEGSAAKLMAKLEEIHPYDTPAIIELKSNAVNEAFGAWCVEEVG